MPDHAVVLLGNANRILVTIGIKTTKTHCSKTVLIPSILESLAGYDNEVGKSNSF